MTDLTRSNAAAQLTREWATDPRWRGIERDYSADDVIRLRGRGDHRAHACQPRAALLWRLLHEESYVNALRRFHGRAGGPDGSRRAACDLPLRLAGRCRRQPRGIRLSGPEPLSANSVPAMVRRLNNALLLRADRIEWAEGDKAANGSPRSSPTPRPVSAGRSTRSS